MTSTFCGQVLLEVCFGLINSCRHFAQFLPETESGTRNFQRLIFRGENMLRPCYFQGGFPRIVFAQDPIARDLTTVGTAKMNRANRFGPRSLRKLGILGDSFKS